jgi:hypothetical protein
MALRHCELLTFEDGQQVLVRGAPHLSVTVVIGRTKAKQRVKLEPVDSEDFVALSEKLSTHTVEFDTITKKMKLTKKAPPQKPKQAEGK